MKQVHTYMHIALFTILGQLHISAQSLLPSITINNNKATAISITLENAQGLVYNTPLPSNTVTIHAKDYVEIDINSDIAKAQVKYNNQYIQPVKVYADKSREYTIA